MYAVEFSKRAVKEFAALERGDQIRILKKLEVAANDPARLFMPLKGVDGFRRRVGGLRVIADVRADHESIIVAAIGKRANIYK